MSGVFSLLPGDWVPALVEQAFEAFILGERDLVYGRCAAAHTGVVVCGLLLVLVDVDDEGKERWHTPNVDCVYEGEVFEALRRQAFREISDEDLSVRRIGVD